MDRHHPVHGAPWRAHRPWRESLMKSQAIIPWHAHCPLARPWGAHPACEAGPWTFPEPPMQDDDTCAHIQDMQRTGLKQALVLQSSLATPCITPFHPLSPFKGTLLGEQQGSPWHSSQRIPVYIGCGAMPISHSQCRRGLKIPVLLHAGSAAQRAAHSFVHSF